MANLVAPQIGYQSAGVAAETVSLTTQVKQVSIDNYHATALTYVRVFTGDTAAAALALAVATPAVAAANENFFVGAGKRKTVFKSTRATYVALSTIASGAATTIAVEGTQYRD